MPSNPDKIKNEVFNSIDKILKKITAEGYDYPGLIKQMVLNYPISTSAVKKFIQEFYIDTGELKLEENTLLPLEVKDV